MIIVPVVIIAEMVVMVIIPEIIIVICYDFAKATHELQGNMKAFGGKATSRTFDKETFVVT